MFVMNDNADMPSNTNVEITRRRLTPKIIILVVAALLLSLIVVLVLVFRPDNRDINHFINAFTSAGYTVQHERGLDDGPTPLLGITDSVSIWIGGTDIFVARDLVTIFEFESIDTRDEFVTRMLDGGADTSFGRNGRFLIMTSSRTMVAFFESIR